MSTRSAHATIKGYFYQFDHTIVRILKATAPLSSIIVEGIEDIDLEDGGHSAFIQCKYYEGSSYNHSVIKDAVIQMFKHYCAMGCPVDRALRYRIYGHYKDGQDKLPATFDTAFLKRHFLTYTSEKITHEVYAEMGANDAQVDAFRGLLDIDLHAKSYADQQALVLQLLVAQIPGCIKEDAATFYYPNAINVIQSLAIRACVNDRKITKTQFIAEVNRKEAVFSLWLREKFGNDYYARLIKRKHFQFRSSTKVPKASRFFVIDIAGEFDLSRSVALLVKLSTRFSHREHNRTLQSDRFCPYVLLRGLQPEELVSLKRALLSLGLSFFDGYPFFGSDFSPQHLTIEPTKENAVRLKFVPSVDQLGLVISHINNSTIEIFDFYKESPMAAKHLPAGVPQSAIWIESAYFISEVLDA
jgi:hypothetical protein